MRSVEYLFTICKECGRLCSDIPYRQCCHCCDVVYRHSFCKICAKRSVLEKE